MKIRLDKKIIENYPFLTRTKIQALIESGLVTINGITSKKKGILINDQDLIVINESIFYVSRAANKLKFAIEYFKIKVENLICLDIGSSTGGFCQILLENNAKYIYAIDVGIDQMNFDLKNHKKIELYEKTNFKDVTKEMFTQKIDLITCDVSFISSKIILKKIKELIDYPIKMVLLIKPQFEIGKDSKKTDLNNPQFQQKIINQFESYFNELSIQSSIIIKSPILGKSGNQEYLVYLNFNDEK